MSSNKQMVNTELIMGFSEKAKENLLGLLFFRSLKCLDRFNLVFLFNIVKVVTS